MSLKKSEKVVIMTVNENHARIDRMSLKKMRILHPDTFDNGADGLQYVHNYSVDFMICDWALKDMDVCKFIRMVKRDRKAISIPVVVVTFQNQKDAVLDAIAAGCTGYVLRPYSQETFERHIALAKQTAKYGEMEEEQLNLGRDLVNQGNFDAAIEEFEEIIAIEDEAQKYFDMGNRYLLEEKYGKAIIAFNKAIKINDLFAEAYKGLAAAYKGKGDQSAFQNCMQKAAEIYAQFDRLQDARDVFVEILKNDTQAPNPYNTLGIRLRKKGDLPGAIHAYLQALELMPEDESIHYNLAKAYAMSGDTGNAVEAISKALRVRPDFYEALVFYEQQAGHVWPEAPVSMELRPARSKDGGGLPIDEE